MEIVILHMTLGGVNRGSEASTSIIADYLAKNHEVITISCCNYNSVKHKHIEIKGKFHLRQRKDSLIDKIKNRLYLDEYSRSVSNFTKESLNIINKLKPEIIIPINGHIQTRMIMHNFPNAKVAIFLRAGIGYDDKNNILSNPDIVFALSNKALQWAKKLAKEDTRVVYAPNPIDPSTLHSNRIPKISLNGKVVLTIASSDPYKNLKDIIMAVSNTHHSLLFITNGPKTNELNRLGKKVLGERFLLIDNPKDTLSYYNIANIFAFVPDNSEAFGRVYLEAMSAGLPIIATKDKIRKEIIGKKGNFVAPHDINTITSLINSNIGISKIDYSKELSKFDINTIGENIENELKNL